MVIVLSGTIIHRYISDLKIILIRSQTPIREPTLNLQKISNGAALHILYPRLPISPYSIPKQNRVQLHNNVPINTTFVYTPPLSFISRNPYAISW